jgi:hypothetical protein
MRDHSWVDWIIINLTIKKKLFELIDYAWLMKLALDEEASPVQHRHRANSTVRTGTGTLYQFQH